MLAGQAVMVNWSNEAAQHRPAYYHWHGNEHMVGRLTIPGYRRGRRFAAVAASRDFLVLYEVDDIAVITGKGYLEKANNPSPLTQATTPYVTDSARALARVRLSLGIGQGGFMLTLRFDAAAQGATFLDEFVRAALRAAAQLPGVVGAHFCVADTPASRMVPRERQGRPTTIPAWVVLLEGITPEAVEEAANRHFAPASFVEHGATGSVERDLYALQIAVSNA
jgi:hypothetical protein